jgi:hypothetical protein
MVRSGTRDEGAAKTGPELHDSSIRPYVGGKK